MPKTELKNQIRRLGFDNGEMTQQELAKRVRVTRQTIIAIEHRKYTPSLELAFRTAHAFGKRVEEVFQYEDAASENGGSEQTEQGQSAPQAGLTDATCQFPETM